MVVLSSKNVFVLILLFLYIHSILSARFEKIEDSAQSINLSGDSRSLTVGNWNLHGVASVEADHMLIGSQQSKTSGAIWNKSPVAHEAWEIIATFQVNGDATNSGDGFAFWYVSSPGMMGGTFGNEDAFEGLGIIFDSYDDDGKEDNPLVMGMINDKTKTYNFAGDGAVSRFGGCRAKFRNRQSPSKIKIIYEHDSVNAMLDMKNNGKWEKCMHREHIYLPTRYFMGWTASNSRYSDDVKIIDMQVYRLGASFDVSEEGKSVDVAMNSPNTAESGIKSMSEEFKDAHSDLLTRIEAMMSRHHKTSLDVYETIRDQLGELLKQQPVSSTNTNTALSTATTTEGSSKGNSGEIIAQITQLLDTQRNHMSNEQQSSRDEIINMRTLLTDSLGKVERAANSMVSGGGNSDLKMTLDKLDRNQQRLLETCMNSSGAVVDSSSSFFTGIGFYFVCCQVLFIVVFLVWRGFGSGGDKLKMDPMRRTHLHP